MNIEELLRAEIKSELEELKHLPTGSEELKAGTDNVVKLIDRAIEMERLGIESQDKAEAREIETELKLKEMKEAKKDRWVKYAVDALGISAPIALTIWGVFKTFEFEKTGTITTMLGRGFINGLLRRK